MRGQVGGSQKNPSRAEIRGLGRRPPSGRQVPQVASCESRAWRSGSAIIPVGGLPNAMALIVRRCQPSGPSKSPKIYRTLPFTVLPWSRNPSSSSEIEG
ncbi:hypothetical protein MTP99_002336 [Tenebrio molitor]|nr:hypothetical protein MTP99_002336 [Tenebrio molitor]